jgi:hypothetical protein
MAQELWIKTLWSRVVEEKLMVTGYYYGVVWW